MSSDRQFSQNHSGRPLHEEELVLLRTLIGSKGPHTSLLSDISELHVCDMADGRMGSIRFDDVDRPERMFGREIARTTYIERDGVEVSIAINVDQHGRLFEIDFWKVDFSPLCRYPEPEELIIEN